MPKRSKRLSDANVAKLKAEKTNYIVWDTRTPGFGVRVQPSGHKSFVYLQCHATTSKRVTLGRAAILGVEAARDACFELELAERANRAQGAAQTVRAPLLRDFVQNEWRTAYYNRYKPSTRKGVRQALRKHLLPQFGKLRLDQVSHTDIARWFDHYSESAPGGANQTLGVLRQILNFAIARGHIRTSPAKGIRMNPRRKPTRFLSHEEIQRLRKELDRCVDERPAQKPMADIIRLLLLTGCRLGEIQRLKWCEVREGGLHLTDAKSGPRQVFLSAEARAILNDQVRTSSGYVFPSPRDPARPTTRDIKLWYRVRRRAGLEDVRLHDLRHTFASHAVIGGVPLPLVSKLLGHRQVSMTLRYAHVHDAHVEAASERIGQAIERLCQSVGV